MARIEISIEEYNSLKDRIKSLEEGMITASKEVQTYKDKLNQVRTVLYGLGDIGLKDRIFNWREYIKPLKELFPEDES